MAEGFLQADFEIPYASDRSDQAAWTYKNRHEQLGYGLKYYCGDVQELAKENNLKDFLGEDINNLDVVCGGPPCQGFSMAGKRNPDDLRNQLVRSYIHILEQVKPKYFVMENVTGILSAKFNIYEGKKETYTNEFVTKVLLQEFKEIGYSFVEFKTLDASDFGVPQKRKRVIFLGTRDDITLKLHHPSPNSERKISARDAISDLEKIENGSKLEKYLTKPESNYQKESRRGRTQHANGSSIGILQLYNHETSRHRAKKY